VGQCQVLALLVALAALAIPASGAFLSVEGSSPVSYGFLGAVSLYDFVPVLMLVGALGLLVSGVRGRDTGRRGVGATAGAVLALAGAVLAIAYFGSAYQLRAGGQFAFDIDGAPVDWTFTRIALVGSLAAAGVLCASVLMLAVTWLTGRRTGVDR